MIVITGAAGFIGSRFAAALNDEGRDDLLLSDDFSVSQKDLNWKRLRAAGIIHRELLFEQLGSRWKNKVSFFIQKVKVYVLKVRFLVPDFQTR